MAQDKKKKIVIAAIIVVIVIIAAIIFALFWKKGYRTVKIFEIFNKVTFDRDSQKDVDVYENMALKAGDTLRTGADESFARLVLDDDKYVYIEENSEVAFEAAGRKNTAKTTVHLNYGAVINEVNSKLSDKQSYEVVTPNSLMAVRGTKFRASTYYGADGILYTRVSTIEGKVECWLIYPDGTISSESHIAEAGTEVLVYYDEESGITDFARINDAGRYNSKEEGDYVRSISYAQMPKQALSFLHVRATEIGGLETITPEELAEYEGLDDELRDEPILERYGVPEKQLIEEGMLDHVRGDEIDAIIPRYVLPYMGIEATASVTEPETKEEPKAEPQKEEPTDSKTPSNDTKPADKPSTKPSGTPASTPASQPAAGPVSTPTDNQTPPDISSDDTPQTPDDSTPSGDGTTPSGDGTTPSGDGTTPSGDGTTPSGDGTTPSGDGSTPSGDGTTPSGDGSTPSGDGTTPSGGGSDPSGGGSTPSGDPTGGSTPSGGASGYANAPDGTAASVDPTTGAVTYTGYNVHQRDTQTRLVKADGSLGYTAVKDADGKITSWIADPTSAVDRSGTSSTLGPLTPTYNGDGDLAGYADFTIPSSSAQPGTMTLGQQARYTISGNTLKEDRYLESTPGSGVYDAFNFSKEFELSTDDAGNKIWKEIVG